MNKDKIGELAEESSLFLYNGSDRDYMRASSYKLGFNAGFKKSEELYKDHIAKVLRYMMTNELYFGSRQNGNRVDGEYIKGFIKRVFKNVEEDMNKNAEL